MAPSPVTQPAPSGSPFGELPPEVGRQLLLWNQQSLDQELLFLATVRDAAVLAGEQVQDVRLRFLEDPPGVESYSFFMDVVLAVTLGPLAGKAVGALAKGAVGKILGSRGISWQVDGASVVRRVISAEAAAEGARVMVQTEHLEQLLVRRDSPARALWTWVAEEVSKTAKDEAVTRGKAALGKLAPLEARSASGDTASVAIRRTALAFARTQEAASRQTHADWAQQIAGGAFPPAAAPALTGFFMTYFLQPPDRRTAAIASNEELERRMSLQYEAVIWAAHLGPQKHLARPELLANRLLIKPDYKPLLSYLVNRLPHPSGRGSFLEHECLTGNFSAGRARNPFLPGDMGEFSSAERAITTMLAWLGEVARSVEEAGRSLGGTGLEVLGPTKPKSS